MNDASASAERRLIVNADDLGMSESVNDAIFELMEAELVTSSTILANGIAAAEAARSAKRFTHCSFGVHLNLTSGRPVGPPGPLHSLLDETGQFTTGVFGIAGSRGLAKAVAAEWCAQVEAVRSLGVRISHFDSHEHVHTIPWVFTAFKSVQKQFGVRRARLTKNVYCREVPAASPLLSTKKMLWNAALRHYYRTRTTRWFADLYSVSRAAHERTLGSGSIEAMVHPGASAEPINVTELEELRGGVLERLPFRIRMISYHEL